MTTTELKAELSQKAKSLKERYPDTSRPGWAARELDLLREMYRHLNAKEQAENERNNLQQIIGRMAELNEMLEETIQLFIRWRPHFFEYNRPAPTAIGNVMLFQVARLFPNDSTEKNVLLQFYNDATTHENEPNESPYKPITKPGTYNTYSRNIRELCK